MFMNLLLRRRMMMQAGDVDGNAIITSHGVFFDTSFIPSGNTKIETLVEFQDESNGYIYGARTSASTNIFMLSNQVDYNRSRMGYGTSYKYAQMFRCGEQYLITQDRGDLYINGSRVLQGPVKSFVSTRSLYIGSTNTEKGNPDKVGTAIPLKIYYFKIWDNDELVRNYIPHKRGYKIGFVDKLTNNLITNQGEGTVIFIP